MGHLQNPSVESNVISIFHSETRSCSPPGTGHSIGHSQGHASSAHGRCAAWGPQGMDQVVRVDLIRAWPRGGMQRRLWRYDRFSHLLLPLVLKARNVMLKSSGCDGRGVIAKVSGVDQMSVLGTQGRAAGTHPELRGPRAAGTQGCGCYVHPSPGSGNDPMRCFRGMKPAN